MRFIKRYWQLCILLLCVCASANSKAQTANSTYAFLHIEQDGKASVHFLDGENETAVKPLSAPEGYLFARVVSGSWNQWIAGVFAAPIAGSGDDLLQLINIDTGEIQEVLKGKLSTVINSYYDIDQTIAWSPTGQLIAVAAAVTDQWDVHIFDTASGTLHSLGLQLASPSQLVWSADSSHLAAIYEHCQPDVCSQLVSVFDSATNTLVKSYDLTAALKIPFGAKFCKLNWSPDGNFVGFIFNCDLISIDIIKEFYLLELQTGQVQQLTNYKRDMLAQENVLIAAGDYQLYWQPDNTLVLGMLVYSNLATLSQTLLIKPPDLTPTLLLEGNSEEWLENPVDDSIALRLVEVYDAADRSPEVASVKIVTIEANVVSNRQTLPLGCNLDWSEDGLFLAYSTHTENGCQTPVTGFIFYDLQRQDTIRYTIPTSSVKLGDRVIPLGWVEIGAVGQ